MKISQLVATKKYTQYYESVANKLPRGIKTQQQLLNLGYSIAVNDLGLAKAKTLDENFAAKLVNSYHKQCIDEGIGSFLGKAAGNVVGAVGAAGRGIKNAWNDAKQGYKDAKGAWDENPPTPAGTGAAPRAAPAGGTASPAAPAGGTAAPAGGTAAPAGGTAAPGAAPAGGTATPGAAPAGGTTTPAGGGTDRPFVAPAGVGVAGAGGIGDIMKAIDGLDPASKTQLAGELEKSIASTPAPAATTTPDELDAVKKNAGLPAEPAGGTAEPAGGTAEPAATTPDELDAVKKNAGLPAAAPAGGTASPAAPAAAAPTGKLTQAQQDAKKAELKGKRSAGKTTASQTGSGFKDYVGGSQTKLVGADKTGAPVFKKLNRESVGFSNFLDMDI